ncbi:MAG: dUTP diphosphatase [Spirochaetales bacterium]|nr:dUTP diphosphatase [Spirochaetales bacterium]
MGVALLSGAQLPRRATEQAAGYDVSACLPPDTVFHIDPMERIAIPTGLILVIPPGYSVTLRPRSGLALKHGITLLNSPATIDSDYRGELKVLLANLGKERFTIEHGDRIAQMLLEAVLPLEFQAIGIDQIPSSERGAGGFGSTGLA